MDITYGTGIFFLKATTVVVSKAILVVRKGEGLQTKKVFIAFPNAMSEDSSIIEITFSADLKKINEIGSLNFFVE